MKYKTLLNSDVEYYAAIMEAEYLRMVFFQRHPAAYKIYSVLEEWLWFRILRLVCKCLGHRMEDTGSFAGPDSGADDLTCSRCGYHFYHIYY